MATFDDGPYTVTIDGIALLTERDLEDTFMSAIARVEATGMESAVYPAVERRPQRKSKVSLEDIAIQSLEYPMLLDLDDDGYEYTADDVPPTWKVITQRVYPLSEADARKVLDIIGRSDFREKAKRWGVKTKATQSFWSNVKEIEDLIKKGKWPPRQRPGGRVPQAEARFGEQSSKLPTEVSNILLSDPVTIPLKFNLPKGKAMPRTSEQSERIVDLGLKANWGARQVAFTHHHPAWEVVRAFEDLMSDEEFAEYQRRKKSYQYSKEPGQSRAPQTEQICPICGGPGMSMGILGRKHWFRCRDCGMQWSIDAKRSSRLPSVHLYATPARQIMDDLEKYWKAGNTDEFYKLLEQVKKAIAERERGKIKLLPDISLTELRDIKNQADRLYR